MWTSPNPYLVRGSPSKFKPPYITYKRFVWGKSAQIPGSLPNLTLRLILYSNMGVLLQPVWAQLSLCVKNSQIILFHREHFKSPKLFSVVFMQLVSGLQTGNQQPLWAADDNRGSFLSASHTHVGQSKCVYLYTHLCILSLLCHCLESSQLKVSAHQPAAHQPPAPPPLMLNPESASVFSY